ncbi:patatin-like phospholipase family protein [Candidatus Poribacteria bacterium]|nr:patatin-like phospholipase family protein [Candidatus Poribacteria bacterium]
MQESTNQYDLVFEGGGAKGIVFVGAMQEFESRGYTSRRLIGTSAGAITATLLAARYTAEELLDATMERTPNGKPRFSTFMDTPEAFSERAIENSFTFDVFRSIDIPLVPEWMEKQLDQRIFNQLMKLDIYREIFSFVERGGLYAGNKFLEWIREKLNAKGTNLGNATLSEFYQQNQKDLSVVASDTTAQEMLVLNHRTAPQCPVAWAVRMSMSIPFVWQEVLWKREWGTYQNQDLTGHTIVDGGALSNFPLDLVISRDKEVLDVMGNTDPDGADTLGLLIDESAEVPNSRAPADDDEESGLASHVQHLRVVRRIKRLVDTMMQARDKQVIEAYQDKVCRLPAKGYGTTEFDMSDARMEALIEAGRNAIQKFFSQTPPV